MENKFNSIFLNCMNVLSKSKEIKKWVDDNTLPPETKLYIFEGILKEDQPENSLYPAIAFSSVENVNQGDGSKDLDFLLAIGVAIKHEQVISGSYYTVETIDATASTIETKVYKIQGKALLNQLWLIICNEILSIKNLHCKIDTIGQAQYEEVYPIFKFSGTFKFSFRKEMRTGNRL